MNIAFINNSRSFKNASLKCYTSNPGIGGTEYVTFKLICELAIRNPKWDFHLVTKQQLINDSDLQNVHIDNGSSDIDYDVCIVPTSYNKFFKELKLKYKKAYAWSHHPHDQCGMNNLLFDGFISIGQYQYYSNYFRFGPHLLLENPFPQPQLQTHKAKECHTPNDPLTFVYLGGVNPAKGLHKVILNWPAVSLQHPNSTLNIIGGDLYNEENAMSEDCLLVGGSYGQKLKKVFNSIPKHARNKITFHGKINQSKVHNLLMKSNIALLNPTGKSEAAPASPLECACYAIPTVAGADFGMADIMELYKSLDVKKYRYEDISERLKNREYVRVLQKKSLEYAKQNYSKNEAIYRNWYTLLMSKSPPSPKIKNFKLFKISIRSFNYRYPRRFAKFLLSNVPSLP